MHHFKIIVLFQDLIDCISLLRSLSMGNEFDSTKAPRNLSARQINYSLYSFFISILSKAIAKIRNNSLLAQKHFIKLPYFTTVMTPRIRDK